MTETMLIESGVVEISKQSRSFAEVARFQNRGPDFPKLNLKQSRR